MIKSESINGTDIVNISMSASHSNVELGVATGKYHVQILECAGGRVINEFEFDNLVTTEGVNYVLGLAIANAVPTVSSVLTLFTAGTPTNAMTYAVPVITEITSGQFAARIAPTWAAASARAIAPTAAVSFTALGAVTITGAALILGNSAQNLTTVGNTTATANRIYSAGTFPLGQPLIANNVVNITYSTTWT